MGGRWGQGAVASVHLGFRHSLVAALGVVFVLLSAAVPALADVNPPNPPTPPTSLRLLDPPLVGPAQSTPTSAPVGSGGTRAPGLDLLAAGTSVSVSRLYDLARTAAAAVIAPHLEPGGGSGSAGWTPPADLRTPSIPATPPSAVVPSRPLTTYERLGAAYTSATQQVRPSCHLSFALLAALGEVESSSLRGHRLDRRGDAVPRVVGPALSGGRFASISDSDGGRLDGDPVWDHAVGPMQFIPATWRIWGADGNGDGVADPQNVDDAALAAGDYVCAGGRDLSRRADLEDAILSYNHSRTYLRTVLGIVDALTNGLVGGP